MLLMKKVYFDAIRRGVKTTTLRYWRHARVKPGSVHFVPGLGRVEIRDVRTVTLSQLTAADAHADGFPSLRALKQALGTMYPASQREGRKLYRVAFRSLA